MKVRLFVVGTLLLLCAACHTPTHEARHATSLQELSVIDSLMWRQPDSALAVLLKYLSNDGRGNTCSVSTDETFDNHYAQLLASELLYKNDYEQTNRTALLQAVEYFDSLLVMANGTDTRGMFLKRFGRRDAHRASAKTTAFLDARAHYINGVGYYENDSMVEACKEYLKALEVMEGQFREKELTEKKAQFMALNFTHLAVLYSDLYLHEQSVFWAKSSLAYYQKYDHPLWHSAWILNKIGSNYDMMNQSDSATYYYQKAIFALADTTTLMYRDIVAHLICLKYGKGIYQADAATKRLRKLLQNSESDRERQVRYMYIGEIFYHEQNYDSAWVYLDTVFQTTSVVGLKRQAAEWLIEICKIQGKESDIFEYADFLVPFANQEENQSATKSELTELYKAFGQAQQERLHQDEMRRHLNQSISIIAGLSLVTVIVLALYHNNKHRKQRLESQINEEKKAHSIEKKALSNRLKKSNETLRELQNQIKQQNRDSFIKPETQAATFMDEPICRLIMERVHAGQFKSQINCTIYKNYALSKEQLIALQDATNRHFNRFTIRLVQAYPDITKSDIDYCCLHLLSLNDADMSALMQRAYNTINERNSKLKKVLGCKCSISIALKVFANNRTSS